MKSQESMIGLEGVLVQHHNCIHDIKVTIKKSKEDKIKLYILFFLHEFSSLKLFPVHFLSGVCSNFPSNMSRTCLFYFSTVYISIKYK